MTNEGSLVGALHEQLDSIIEKTKEIYSDQKSRDKEIHAKCAAPIKPADNKSVNSIITLIRGTSAVRKAAKKLKGSIGSNPMGARELDLMEEWEDFEAMSLDFDTF